MGTFLLKLLELSLQAGILTIAILLLRLIFRKFPAKYLCALWAIVAIRLVLPFSFESSVAPMWSLTKLVENQKGSGDIWGELVSVTETYEDGTVKQLYPGTDSNDEVDYYITDGKLYVDGEEVDSYAQVPVINESIYYVEESEYYTEIVDVQVETTIPGTDTNEETDYYLMAVSPTPVPEGIAGIVSELNYKLRNRSVTPFLSGLWLLGIGLLMGYGVYSCVKVKRYVKNAICYEENIWLLEGLQTPFLFGWRHPQIYLPTNLEEAQIGYVVEHEKSHIARGDQYTKLLGYALLCVYWFNPLIWLAYIAFCKDVERACDEKVISKLSVEDRKGYAEALLKCSTDSKVVITNPLSFGEIDVKRRIIGILGYKKPGRWLAVLAVVLCLTAIAGCFFVNKEPGETEVFSPTEIPVVTPTASPTVAPSSEERGNGPSIQTPTPMGTVSKLTPTPLPPSDLTLLGKVAEGTVIAVPMGQTVEADLDGDGTKDVITCGYEGFGEGEIFEKLTGGSWQLHEAFFRLNINGNTFRGDEIREEYWNDGPGFTTYYIFDVNTEDKYKEIGLYFDGPSGDPSTALYRYINGKLYCVGVFESATLESDYSWNSRDYADVTYEEMVQNVDREEFVISVPGDGTIFCEERTVFYETTAVVREYKLWNQSMAQAAILQETVRDRYEFTNWQYDREELNVKAKKDFTAYAEPVDMSEEFHKDLQLVGIPKGTRVSFYAYYPDNGWTAGWVELFYGENLENTAWIYHGTDKQGNSVIYLPNGVEDSSWNLFLNLSMAG